jgi:hypothetical protein
MYLVPITLATESAWKRPRRQPAKTADRSAPRSTLGFRLYGDAFGSNVASNSSQVNLKADEPVP